MVDSVKQTGGTGVAVGSAFLPGLGQLCDGRNKEGAFYMIGVGGLGTGGTYLINKYNKDVFEAECKANREKFEAECKAMDERFEAQSKAMRERFEAECKAINERFEAESRAIKEEFGAMFGNSTSGKFQKEHADVIEDACEVVQDTAAKATDSTSKPKINVKDVKKGGLYAGIALAVASIALYVANIVDAYKGGNKQA